MIPFKDVICTPGEGTDCLHIRARPSSDPRFLMHSVAANVGYICRFSKPLEVHLFIAAQRYAAFEVGHLKIARSNCFFLVFLEETIMRIPPSPPTPKTHTTLKNQEL